MKTKIFFIALIACSFFISCSDDDVMEGGENGGIDNVIEEEVLAKIHIDWNASLPTVKDSTTGYELLTSESDFLHYYSKKLDQTVSYEFKDNFLSAVAIALPLTDSVQKAIEPLLAGFEYIGDKDSVSTFVSQGTFAVKYQTSELADTLGTYVIVGFTPLAE